MAESRKKKENRVLSRGSLSHVTKERERGREGGRDREREGQREVTLSILLASFIKGYSGAERP
jgi:hypothetical protein